NNAGASSGRRVPLKPGHIKNLSRRRALIAPSRSSAILRAAGENKKSRKAAPSKTPAPHTSKIVRIATSRHAQSASTERWELAFRITALFTHSARSVSGPRSAPTISGGHGKATGSRYQKRSNLYG